MTAGHLTKTKGNGTKRRTEDVLLVILLEDQNRHTTNIVRLLHLDIPTKNQKGDAVQINVVQDTIQKTRGTVVVVNRRIIGKVLEAADVQVHLRPGVIHQEKTIISVVVLPVTILEAHHMENGKIHMTNTKRIKIGITAGKTMIENIKSLCPFLKGKLINHHYSHCYNSTLGPTMEVSYILFL